MKAKIIKTGEIVDVYHEPQHGQVSNIYKESVFINGRMWQENELEFIDSLQEEPVSIWHRGDEFKDVHYTRIYRKVIGNAENKRFEIGDILEVEDGAIDILNKDGSIVMCIRQDDSWAYIDDILKLSNVGRNGKNWKEEPVSEDLEKAAKQYEEDAVFYAGRNISDFFKAGAKWQKTKDESTTEDLGEYINELSKQFPEVSFAKLSRIAVRVAKWKEEQMMAKAIDGYVIEDVGNGDFVLSADYLPKSIGLKDQQSVKVIVIKED